MSHKGQKIAALIHAFQGRELDAHYLGFFQCFNQQLFFEAHEVLEVLWLARRGREDDLFYKGLIQLAGAFVHIQKKRRQPAMALFKLARENLNRYPAVYQSLDVGRVSGLIGAWISEIDTEMRFAQFLAAGRWPSIALESAHNSFGAPDPTLNRGDCFGEPLVRYYPKPNGGSG